MDNLCSFLTNFFKIREISGSLICRKLKKKRLKLSQRDNLKCFLYQYQYLCHLAHMNN